MPKECVPLPWIDLLVDATTYQRLLGFLDVNFTYNEILIHNYEEKTAFYIGESIYFYHVMPFGLKNVGVTYQSLINKLFSTQFGRMIEAYVDNTIVEYSTTTH